MDLFIFIFIFSLWALSLTLETIIHHVNYSAASHGFEYHVFFNVIQV